MKIDSYNYFVSNHDALFKQYPNRYLVIVNNKVVHDADTMSLAVNWVDRNKVEDAIIQHCTEGASAYSSSFCSQIIVK